MDAQFQFVQLDHSDAVENFTREKLNNLEKKYDYIVRAQVIFKKEEGQDPRGYICNIKLSVPGPQIFAESNEESFEAAAAETVRDLERQLSKQKGKMNTHI